MFAWFQWHEKTVYSIKPQSDLHQKSTVTASNVRNGEQEIELLKKVHLKGYYMFFGTKLGTENQWEVLVLIPTTEMSKAL